MSMNKLIPLETWLGYFKEKTDAASLTTKKVFIQSSAVKTSVLGKPKEGMVVEHTDFNQIYGSELVIGINAILNTDTPCWPEGLREDCSNLQLSYDSEDEKFRFIIVIKKDEIEDKEFFENIIKDNPEIEDTVIFVFEPKFDSFIDNTSPAFMELLTGADETARAINEGMAIAAQISELAPKFRIMKIDFNKTPELAFLDEPQQMAEQIRVGICRYFNRVTPGFIHEDMVPNLNHVRIVKNSEGEIDILTSFKVFGQLYLFSAILDLDFDPNAGEDEVMDEEV